MAIRLDEIVPWGRSAAEYDLMFNLIASELSQGVLDCGGGPSDFTARQTACGVRAVAVDPIYAYSGAEIRARFEACVDTIMSQVRATPDDWVWKTHGNPDQLHASRRGTIERFLADYDAGLKE